jgi:hypothetical protein
MLMMTGIPEIASNREEEETDKNPNIADMMAKAEKISDISGK